LVQHSEHRTDILSRRLSHVLLRRLNGLVLARWAGRYVWVVPVLLTLTLLTERGLASTSRRPLAEPLRVLTPPDTPAQ